MRAVVVALGLLILAGHGSPARTAADEPKGKDKAAPDLVGTWKLVSAKYGGRESDLPKEVTTLKHMTPTHYSWASYDKDGQVTRTAGGPYALKGDTLESRPEYGLGPDFEVIKGKPQTYKCKVEGNRWLQTGTLSNGTTLEEVWERVEKK